MEILYVCSSTDFLTGSFELACYLARRTNSVLVGVILESLYWEETPIVLRSGSRNYIDYTVSTAIPENDKVRAESEEQIKKFKDACIASEVRHRVHIDRNKPLRELLLESRYADLIILNTASFYPNGGNESKPIVFVKNILEKTECPVIVGPQHFEKIDRLVFAYDGSLNAVYAIKQFSYLLPIFKDISITLVEVLTGKHEYITEKHKLSEWLNMHYSDVKFVSLNGVRSEKLIGYLAEIQNAMIIIGGYGRGILSQLFSPSISEPIVSTVDMPVFIAHVPE